MNELMDVELNELVSMVSEIDYEGDGFQLLQNNGINDKLRGEFRKHAYYKTRYDV